MISLLPTISGILCLFVMLKRFFCLDEKKRFKLRCFIIGLSYIWSIFSYINNQSSIYPFIIFGCSAFLGFFELLFLPDDNTNNK